MRQNSSAAAIKRGKQCEIQVDIDAPEGWSDGSMGWRRVPKRLLEFVDVLVTSRDPCILQIPPRKTLTCLTILQ